MDISKELFFLQDLMYPKIENSSIQLTWTPQNNCFSSTVIEYQKDDLVNMERSQKSCLKTNPNISNLKSTNNLEQFKITYYLKYPKGTYSSIDRVKITKNQ